MRMWLEGQHLVQPFYKCEPLVKVWPSSVIGLGLGLFARKYIRKGKVCSIYSGRLVSSVIGNSSDFLLGPMDHVDPVTGIKSRWYVDSTDINCGSGRWVNDACDYDGVEHLRLDRETNIKFRLRIAPNIHPTYQQYYVEMYALKDIRPGMELFVEYGKEYWTDTIKYYRRSDHTILSGPFEQELDL